METLRLGFAFAKQVLQGQCDVILGQHLFDGACLQFLRQCQTRREDTAEGRELLRQAFQLLRLGGRGAGTLPAGKLFGIPPEVIELSAMRLAHPAYRIVVQDMRAWARLFETLDNILGAFQHPVNGLANHGQRIHRMPLRNAMLRHGVLPSERRCQRRSLCPPAYQTSPALSLSKPCLPKIPMIWVNTGSISRRNRGMFTAIPR